MSMRLLKISILLAGSFLVAVVANDAARVDCDEIDNKKECVKRNGDACYWNPDEDRCAAIGDGAGNPLGGGAAPRAAVEAERDADARCREITAEASCENDKKCCWNVGGECEAISNNSDGCKPCSKLAKKKDCEKREQKYGTCCWDPDEGRKGECKDSSVGSGVCERRNGSPTGSPVASLRPSKDSSPRGGKGGKDCERRIISPTQSPSPSVTANPSTNHERSSPTRRWSKSSWKSGKGSWKSGKSSSISGKSSSKGGKNSSKCGWGSRDSLRSTRYREGDIFCENFANRKECVKRGSGRCSWDDLDTWSCVGIGPANAGVAEANHLDGAAQPLAREQLNSGCSNGRRVSVLLAATFAMVRLSW